METPNFWLLLIIFAAVLLFVTVLAATIGYFWASSRTKTALLDQNEAVFRRAQEQLQNWKDQELIPIKNQIFEAAKGQAIQEMQEQVKKWQERELQEARQQIHDAVKGQATQEMAANIQQWQQNELQYAKKQITEALRGEAIRDAQEQLVSWREQELENSKRQISEVLNKEAQVALEQWKSEQEGEIRKDAIDKSQSVTIGKMTEHIIPYLPGFRFNPADARFIGSPIDFLIFDGLGKGAVEKVVFVEIKTGSSNLSTRERGVRNAILDKKVEWLEIKVNLDSTPVIQEGKSRRRLP